MFQELKELKALYKKNEEELLKNHKVEILNTENKMKALHQTNIDQRYQIEANYILQKLINQIEYENNNKISEGIQKKLNTSNTQYEKLNQEYIKYKNICEKKNNDNLLSISGLVIETLLLKLENNSLEESKGNLQKKILKINDSVKGD